MNVHHYSPSLAAFLHNCLRSTHIVNITDRKTSGLTALPTILGENLNGGVLDLEDPGNGTVLPARTVSLGKGVESTG